MFYPTVIAAVAALGLTQGSSSPLTQKGDWRYEELNITIEDVQDREGTLPECFFDRGGCGDRGYYVMPESRPAPRSPYEPIYPNYHPKYQGRPGEGRYLPQYERDMPGYGYGGWGQRR